MRFSSGLSANDGSAVYVAHESDGTGRLFPAARPSFWALRQVHAANTHGQSICPVQIAIVADRCLFALGEMEGMKGAMACV